MTAMPAIHRLAAFASTLALALGLSSPASASDKGQITAQQRQAFLAEVQKKHGISPETAGPLLDQARYQQSIIDAITRPAEAKPWKDYRPIFMTNERISNGQAFLAQHRSALDAEQTKTGVPAAIVVAILGVETSYGSNTGRYKVLDALYTLGFFYPKRADFFRSELVHAFALAHEEKLDLTSITGSYAGAMGWGQFIPSSYRAYAVDGDGNGQRDLWNSLPDVFGSVANYFKAHHWRAGEPVAVPALLNQGAQVFDPGSMEPKYTLAQLAAKGIRPAQPIRHDIPATLLTLQGADGPEYWITFRNFYVISRYNRSPLYSMAVFQLAQAIADVHTPTLEP